MLKEKDKLLCVKPFGKFKEGQYYSIGKVDDFDKTIYMDYNRWEGEWFWLKESPINDMVIDRTKFPPLKEFFATEIDVRRIKLEKLK